MASDAPEIDTEILRLLKEHPSRFISGETISHRLNLTRTPSGKGEKAQTSGYVIEAYPRADIALLKRRTSFSPPKSSRSERLDGWE